LFKKYNLKKVKSDSKVEIDKESISIDDVMRLKLKTANVIAAKRVEKSNKLIKLDIDVGGQKRIIVAGIGLAYSPEDLIGKTIVIVSNLAPRKLFGIESNGMLLAASNDEVLSLLTVDKAIESGSSIH